MNYELIDQYINNELDAKAKADFELAMQNDEALQETATLFLAIAKEKQQTKIGDEAAFRKNLQQPQQHYFNTAKIVSIKNNNTKKVLFGLMAVAAVMVLILTIVPLGNKTYTSEALYNDYNTIETITETTRGSNEDLLFSKAAKFYNEKNYDSAVVYFEQLKDTNAQAMYLYTNSNLQLNKLDKAITGFEALINGTSIYKEKAKFTKALVYLKMNDRAKAKAQLETIKDNESYYTKAKELLKKLK